MKTSLLINLIFLTKENPNEYKVEENFNSLVLKSKKNKDDRNYNRNSPFESDHLLKALPFFLLLSFLEFKKIHCYKASNKELDRVRNLIEDEIKNLEFKYKGLLRREPIK